ncbi:hypothetical protein BFW38_10965 [Terasakiispira papahanaumokuakeensis]|uniref:Cyclic nucleotide-binding protein n=1 Tax=Terasakiispira papahanaumokuakeensis TaxID=197479 RepID=A0A1E2VAE2_9GAMM|nr:DUF294 nucleotidyltransferase-like domain-containing protein [Terasakiispira papahanaumokuakeensis]ODC03980.1 hypothetical protein BFW38_10965 [Terasakiispira papahanaumokuakeensis]
MRHEFDCQQPPFNQLSESQAHTLSQSLDLAYYGQGDIVLDAGQQSDAVFIVMKGVVVELDPDELQSDNPDAGVIGHYTAEDVFGAISIINGRSRYRFRTLEETIVWLLPKAIFLQLMEENTAFADYFRHSLIEKSRLIARHAPREEGLDLSSFMLARVSDTILREAVVVNADCSIETATGQLRQEQADSLLVRHDTQLGMLTRTDLLDAVVMQHKTLSSPVGPLASYNLFSVQLGDFLFNALILMTRHRVQRLVVLNDQTLVGLVELTDILSFFSSQSHVIGLQIERAQSLDSLGRAARAMDELVQSLVAQGVKIQFAMDLLAALNARVMVKAFNLLVPEAYQQHVCLLVMGSEGRGEQVLKTDQDNALIIDDGVEWPECHQVMQQFTETLLSYGYPPCPGNIMVSNPEWVMTASQWHGQLARWAASVEGESLMKLAIVQDAHPVAGAVELFTPIRDFMFDRFKGNSVFFSHFARPILHFATPLNLFGGLKGSEGLDIKKGGIFPIVHGVRALALENGIKITNTFERLKVLAERRLLSRDFADNLAEALAVMSMLRLRQQLKVQAGRVPERDGNRLVIPELNKLDRDLLREALHLVKEFKAFMEHHYHLER